MSKLFFVEALVIPSVLCCEIRVNEVPANPPLREKCAKLERMSEYE